MSCTQCPYFPAEYTQGMLWCSVPRRGYFYHGMPLKCCAQCPKGSVMKTLLKESCYPNISSSALHREVGKAQGMAPVSYTVLRPRTTSPNSGMAIAVKMWNSYRALLKEEPLHPTPSAMKGLEVPGVKRPQAQAVRGLKMLAVGYLSSYSGIAQVISGPYWRKSFCVQCCLQSHDYKSQKQEDHKPKL